MLTSNNQLASILKNEESYTGEEKKLIKDIESLCLSLNTIGYSISFSKGESREKYFFVEDKRNRFSSFFRSSDRRFSCFLTLIHVVLRELDYKRTCQDEIVIQSSKNGKACVIETFNFRFGIFKIYLVQGKTVRIISTSNDVWNGILKNGELRDFLLARSNP